MNTKKREDELWMFYRAHPRILLFFNNKMSYSGDFTCIPIEFKSDVFNNIALPSYRDDILTSGAARKFWSKSDYICTILVAVIAANISMFAAFKMTTVVIVLSSLLVSLQMFSLTAVAQARKCTSVYDNLLTKIGIAPLAQDITLDGIQSQRTYANKSKENPAHMSFLQQNFKARSYQKAGERSNTEDLIVKEDSQSNV